MNISKPLVALGLSSVFFSCSTSNAGSSGNSGLPAPPVAAKKPFEVRAPHGLSREDEYYWLRDDTRKAAEVLEYLNAENAYADAVLAPIKTFEEKLYKELVGRIKQDDSSVPFLYKGYWYYTRFELGKEHPIYARRKESIDAAEQILLDANQLASNKSFYQIGSYRVSPDQEKVAYLEDTVGRRQFTLRVKNLTTGETYTDEIHGLAGTLEWAGDSRTVFYVENDPATLLTKRVRTHAIGSAPATDRLIYEEPDDSFYIALNLTRSEKYVCIALSSTVSNEYRCTDRNRPGSLHVIAARERDFEYNADHMGQRWVIRTNWHATNFKLMQAADGVWDQRSKWVDLIPHDEKVYISGFQLFNDFMAVNERSEGLTRIRIIPSGGEARYVKADESAYSMQLSTNAEPATPWVRYTYTSLTTPLTTFELNTQTGERKLLKEQPVLGGFDKTNYVTERLWATARDGVKIPVSVVYRKGFRKNGTAALLQYGYGSYGLSSDPSFRSNELSLVDRGMVFAIAHIRGGQEMGRAWYDDGKLFHKMNTFTDFIDVTDFLVAEGYAARDRVAALGGSAGGLLMGAISNLAPEKYRVIVSVVPFVDVVTSMLDETIPLTTNEFDEWGNPKDSKYYEYMLSYSPYDQLGAKAYPAMLVRTGLWDSQVQYWEPAKYVARLRARRTDKNLLVFRTQMEAGHGGKSGRFERLRETAEDYAFLLSQVGITAE